MKILVTYEESDIVKMVQRRLAKRGIVAAIKNISFKKNTVVISVDNVEEGPDSDVDDDAPEVAAPVAVASVPVRAPLAVVDGGQTPADMDAILRQSAKNAANPGKFPAPERSLMDGESVDFPGDRK